MDGDDVRSWMAISGAVAVVFALTAWLVMHDAPRDRAPDPAAATAPRVVRLDDAVDAVAGRDYDVIATLNGADAEQATALAPDGAVVLVRTDAGGYPTYTLFDPRTR